jgi:hypothetical protein
MIRRPSGRARKETAAIRSRAGPDGARRPFDRPLRGGGGPLHRLTGRGILTILNFFVRKSEFEKKPLELRAILHIFRLAQIARACGRVSVGGDPDKRPVNRQKKNRQPEANRRTPPNGGRDLKQRRTGLFRLCQISKTGVPKRLVFLAGRADRDFIPFQTKATNIHAGAQPTWIGVSDGAAPDGVHAAERIGCANVVMDGECIDRRVSIARRNSFVSSFSGFTRRENRALGGMPR